MLLLMLWMLVMPVSTGCIFSYKDEATIMANPLKQNLFYFPNAAWTYVRFQNNLWIEMCRYPDWCELMKPGCNTPITAPETDYIKLTGYPAGNVQILNSEVYLAFNL